MDVNTGIAIVGGIIIFGGVIYFLTRKPAGAVPEPPCAEGEQWCDGYNLIECQNGEGVIIETNSPECGYVPEPPEPEPRNIYGYIFDSVSKQPIAGASVTINETQLTSEGTGLFYLYDLPYVASATIVVEATGYHRFEQVIDLPSRLTRIDVELVAFEPEPPPPPTPLSFTYMGFTYVDNTNYVRRVDFVPLGGQSNWGIGWNYPRNVHTVVDFKLKAIYPNGMTKTIRKSKDVFGLGRMAIAYIFLPPQDSYVGTYVFELSAYVDGELIGEKTLEYEGYRPDDMK